MKTFAAVIALLLAASVASAAEPLAFTLKDANGTSHTLDDSVKRLYLSADRAGDKLMKAVMKDLGQATLDQQHAIVVADISAAPGFVKGFIRSSLRDRKYLTWLDEAGSTKKLLPYREDRIGIVQLDRRQITQVRYVSEPEDLRRELLAVPPPVPPTTPATPGAP